MKTKEIKQFLRDFKEDVAIFIFIVLCLAIVVIMGLFVTGCSSLSNRSIVTEYTSDGKISRVTETNESVITRITESTKSKTVIAWESGWMAYLSASTATTQDPTPTVKMFAGKSDKGAISALPNQADWEGISKAIVATKQELTLTPTGIENKAVQPLEKEK